MAQLNLANLTEAFASEVTSVDLARPLDADTLAALVDEFHRRQVLVFRSRVLSPREYVTFIRQFGEPDPSDTSRYHEPIDIDGFKGLRLVSNIEQGGKAIGQFGNDEMGWHQDRWTDAAPPPATALHGVEIVTNGGRTGIANLCHAYDQMPDDLRSRIEGRSICFPLQVADLDGALATADPDDETLFRKVPLVQQHAVTGRKFVFLGARRILSYIDTAPRITGLTASEGALLLDEIYDHISQPQFAYLHDWQQGDVLLFDNRCCAHRREQFDGSQRRLLYGTPLVSSDVLWQAKATVAA